MEYIHVDVKHQLKDRWLVIYEPLDFVPSYHNFVGMLMGAGEDDAWSHFRISSIHGRLAKLSFDSDKIDYGWLWNDGMIEISWYEEPGEHFLSISYRTIKEKTTYRDQNKNWLQEGF